MANVFMNTMSNPTLLQQIARVRVLTSPNVRKSLWYWALMSAKYWGGGTNLPINITIRGMFYIFKHKHAEIKLGDHVRIINKLKYNPAGVVHPTVLRAAVPEAKIVIGDRVGISGAIICCETMVTIGNDCLLGANCSIYDTDYHPLGHIARRNNDQSLVKRRPVVIGNDCWIGANAVILKGVSIGPRSVIGANSVVVSDIPPDTVAAGNPARVIGRITDETAYDTLTRS